MKSRTQKAYLETKKTAQHGRIIVLTGARQTGKTTIARQLFGDYQYLSIEDPVMRGQYTALTAQQWNEFYPFAVLDEVQKEPVLIESIKSVYDQFADPRYVLLGSSQLLLLQKVKESIAGRCHIEEIFPLTLPELRTHTWDTAPKLSVFQTLITTKEWPKLLPSFQLFPDYSERQRVYNYFLEFGGYPALVDESLTDLDRNDWLKNYVRTYLERDIRDLADIKNLEPFMVVQKMSALNTGTLLNFTDLAKESKVTSKTAQKFLTYLEVSYQAIMLQPWYRNPLKRLSKSAKIHYLDPGVQKTIISKSGNSMTGDEYESAIVAELYKQAKNVHFNGEFYHLRTFDGKEVDLLLETAEGFYAFEIKIASTVNHTDARHLRGLSEILDKPLIQSFILSNDPQIKTIDDGIQAIPSALFLT